MAEKAKAKAKPREDNEPSLAELEGNPRSTKTWFGCPLPPEDEDGDPEDME